MQELLLQASPNEQQSKIVELCSRADLFSHLEGDARSCNWPSRFGAFAAASSRGAVLGFS